MGKLDTQATVTLILNGQQAKTSLRDVTSAVNATRAALGRMRQEDNPERYRELITQLGRLRQAQASLREEIDSGTHSQKSFFKEFLQGFSQINAIAGGVAAGTLIAGWVSSALSSLKDLGAAVIKAYATFEKFDAVLTNTLGDAGSSRRALNMLQKFAAETPFSLEELTGSFVKLANRGIIPTTDELRKMGDLAASQGKTFDELTEAILDATTGEFERLKEFGIRGSKNGDMVKLSFKGVTEEVKNTEEAIQEAILAFGEMEGVAGGMEAMSKTVGGQISNMSDNWDRLLTTIGSNTGGMIFGAVSQINEYLDFLVEAFKSTEQRIQEAADNYASGALERYKLMSKENQTALYEGAKLEIQDYEKQIAALEKRKAEIYSKRGDGSQYAAIQDDINDLNLTIARDKALIESVDAYNRQIADADKKRKERERQQNEEQAKKDAEEFKKKTAKYQTDLEGVRTEYLQLAQAAQKGTIDELDAQLKVIDNKYDKLVQKLKKLASDPHASALVKKELQKDIRSINDSGGLRDQAKQNATDGYNEKQAEEKRKERDEQQKRHDAELKALQDRQKGVENTITSSFDTAQADLNEKQSVELTLAASEEAQYNIRTKYAQMGLELEQKRISSIIELRKALGQDTADLEKKYSQNEIKIAANTTAEKNRLKMQEYELAKTITNGLADLIQLTMGNSEIGVAMAKAVTIAQLAIDTASAISSVTARNAATSLTPIDYAIKVAAAVATVMANMLAAKNALSNAGNVKAQKVAKAAKGMIINGPSHDGGGVNLVNNRTGQVIAEAEGGEALLVLSKNTTKNNGPLISELFYNSQYRNGAPVSVDNRLATTPASRSFLGGYGRQQLTQAGKSNDNNIAFNGLLQQQVALLEGMNKAFKDWSKKPWMFPMRQFNEEQQRIDNIIEESSI